MNPPDLDHDVQGPARREAASLRELERFHNDALPRESRIAVDEERQDCGAGLVAALLLSRAHGTFNHRVHHLEVRRIEGEDHVHVAARCAQVRRESLVVLDVTGATSCIWHVLTLELREQHRWRLAEHVDQHIESAAMGHANHDFFDAAGAAALHDVVEERNQRVAAFQREALLADVARVKIAFEAVRRRQLPQEVEALLVAESVIQPPFLEPVLQPEPLLASRHVRELRADPPRIDVPELLQDLRQFHLFLNAARAARGVEHPVEIRIRQAHIGRVEYLGHRPSHQAERVDIRDQVAAVGVELDEAGDGGLLFAVGCRRSNRSGRSRRRRRARHGLRSRLARRWRTAADLTEEFTPFGSDARGIVEEALVLLFDVRRLRARERARFVEFAQGAAHCLRNYTVPVRQPPKRLQ